MDGNYECHASYGWNDANMEVEHLSLVNQYDPYAGWYGTPDDFERSLPDSHPLMQIPSSDGSSYSQSPYSPAFSPVDSLHSPFSDTIDPALLLDIPNPEGFDMTHDMYPPIPDLAQSPPRSAPPPPPPPTTKHKRVDSTSSVTCPFCAHKPKRRADLNRHISHVHKASSSRLRTYRCDYRPCARRDEPFSRRDHFRDHLRDYHREDIEKRGVTVDDAWYWDRNTKPKWWRCSKCLIRVSVDEHGFECPTCGGMCCAKRQEVRMA